MLKMSGIRRTNYCDVSTVAYGIDGVNNCADALFSIQLSTRIIFFVFIFSLRVCVSSAIRNVDDVFVSECKCVRVEVVNVLWMYCVLQCVKNRKTEMDDLRR